MNRSETRDQGNALRAFHPPPSLSIHPSIYLSIVQGGEEEEFSRQRLENNNNNNNSSKKELVSTDNDIPSLLARFEKRVAGQSLPSDVSLLLHLGYAAASGVRSIPRAPLWLVRRSRVELALLDLSETLRPDGKSPAAAEEGRKKGRKRETGTERGPVHYRVKTKEGAEEEDTKRAQSDSHPTIMGTIAKSGTRAKLKAWKVAKYRGERDRVWPRPFKTVSDARGCG